MTTVPNAHFVNERIRVRNIELQEQLDRSEMRVRELEEVVNRVLTAEAQELEKPPVTFEWKATGQWPYLEATCDGDMWSFDPDDDTPEYLRTAARIFVAAAGRLESGDRPPLDPERERRAGWSHATSGKPYPA